MFLLVALLGGHERVIARQLSLTWVSHAVDELGSSIERSTGTAAEFAEVAIVDRGVTAFTDLTVADATAYCYRVRAFNGAAYSEYSNVACAPALDVTLSLNETTVSNGDELTLSAAVHVTAAFANPVDVYLNLSPPSVSPATSFVSLTIPSMDFTGIAFTGMVTDFSSGTYLLSLVIVAAGGDPRHITDRLSNLASISFTVK